MKNNNGFQFRYSLKDGAPIELGYPAVSLTFGIMTRETGLDTWQAVAMPLTNLTSAGQSTAPDIIQAGAPFVEMAMTQLIISLYYCLMPCSLSQKLELGIPSFHRFLMAYGAADEIFGISVCRSGVLNPLYNYGLICIAVPGWTLGTLLGAISGDLLPACLLSALNVALYGMLLAVIIPPAKGNRILTGAILASMALGFFFTRILALDHISSGFKIIILTVMVVSAATILFPVKKEPVNES